MNRLESQLGTVLDAVTRAETDSERVPGVVAMVTDRSGTLFEGAAGRRSLAADDPMTVDTVFAMFSTTKAITGTAVLQCVEDGFLDLDAPAANYLPEIGKLQVIDGFDATGEPQLRAPKREITTRMLLLHTAGFGYSFFDETYKRLADGGSPSVITATRESLHTPLLFDPGDKWQYGSNLDWAGLVVEAIRGERLGTVMAERIFEPLGMTETAFVLDDSMNARRSTIHQRASDGTLTPTDLVLPQNPEVHMGGHGLYSTVGDYTKFLRMWLNDGAGENGRVLAADTVGRAVRNGLEGQSVTMLPGVIPALSHDAEFFPGQRKSWSYTFMINDEEAPTGRPPGALGWAGLANLYYWIDRRNGIAGLWATQILPFADPASFGGYLDFETATYRCI
ncbi:serine hydrolase [Antrihabitans sp. YC2-6]|uniref:serine hydrolase domain-containing protein n=1 Tax=Antrihabitans sp. YC2-6 TaxID=2799498 RepID=UPI0018F3E53F|nr:serine hydrolase domain-containing protein [Antrihabitans sp. YC2-6]MBJ8348922.1 beta-lactamase family protein [Antrihabitans sp. YC2-6]